MASLALICRKISVPERPTSQHKGQPRTSSAMKFPIKAHQTIVCFPNKAQLTFQKERTTSGRNAQHAGDVPLSTGYCSVCVAMAHYMDDCECTWNEMLPCNPIFENLRDVKNGHPVRNGNIFCNIRGNLFVWEDTKKVLLTTNLKRLMAYHTKDDQVYQVCTFLIQQITIALFTVFIYLLIKKLVLHKQLIDSTS